MSSIQVTCCQVELAVGAATHNRGALIEAVQDAARFGADVVVLPELANSGYAFHDSAEAAALAEPLDGPTVTDWIDLAHRHGLVLVGGLCERGETALYNSAVVVDSGGLQAVYRKAHLWDHEKLLFTAGTEPPAVADTAAGRIGVLICYDLELPEWVRLAALDGTELLCAPTNWPDLPRPAGERPMEIVRTQAAAAVNRMFIAVCDRTGPERGTDWVGGSIILEPDGWPLAGPAYRRSRAITAGCTLSVARDKKISDHNDVHADRRPELYRGLTQPAMNTSTAVDRGRHGHG